MGESADNEGYMTLETYLICSDPYRSITQTDPWPLPLDGEHAPHIERQILPLSSEIRAILSSYGFPDHVGLNTFVARKPSYPGGDVPINVLRVILREEDNTPRHLGPATDAILALLRERDIPDVHVEIVNVDLCSNPSLFPISERDPIVAAYESAEEQLIQLLRRSLGSKWRVLCPFNVGRSQSKARPAIVVYVDPLTSANWFRLDSEIKAAVGQYAQGHRVEVEFLPGRLSMLHSGGVSIADRIDPDGRLVMGHSIGIRSEQNQNAGTLGGYFTLTQNGKVHKGLLTAYHVVRPSDSPANSDSLFLRNLDRFGCSFARPPAEDIEVESVASIDRDATITQIDLTVAAINDRAQKMRASMEEREMIGADPLPSQQRLLRQAEVWSSKLSSKRDLFEQMPQLMGKVAAASGKAILGSRIMDWAFVELTEAAADKFFGPNKMPALAPQHQSALYNHKLTLPYPEREPLREFGRLEKGGYYLKLGRTTGVTAGRCNGAVACCNWVGRDRLRYDHNGRQVALSDEITRELMISSVESDGSDALHDDFSTPGDSGSLVIDVDGKVCGLLYGGVNGLNGASAYVGLAMDMTELSNSIILKTRSQDGTNGAQLGLPQEI